MELVVFDFDGVFTDGKFLFSNNGIMMKSYSGKDAYVLNLLNQRGIKTGIITNDESISLEHAFHIFPNLTKYEVAKNQPKLEVLQKWLQEFDIPIEKVAYIGDDYPDICILEKCGFSACPADATTDVKKICKHICSRKGGDYVVREFYDYMVANDILQGN